MALLAIRAPASVTVEDRLLTYLNPLHLTGAAEASANINPLGDITETVEKRLNMLKRPSCNGVVTQSQVYFLRAGSDGPVKIGYAANLPSRLSALQSAHYAPLAIIRIEPGEEALERAFHRYFARLRIRGEWFRYDSEMLSVSVDEAKTSAASSISNDYAPPVRSPDETEMVPVSAALVARLRDVAASHGSSIESFVSLLIANAIGRGPRIATQEPARIIIVRVPEPAALPPPNDESVCRPFKHGDLPSKGLAQ